jgi:hypothetical protein
MALLGTGEVIEGPAEVPVIRHDQESSNQLQI